MLVDGPLLNHRVSLHGVGDDSCERIHRVEQNTMVVAKLNPTLEIPAELFMFRKSREGRQCECCNVCNNSGSVHVKLCV